MSDSAAELPVEKLSEDLNSGVSESATNPLVSDSGQPKEQEDNVEQTDENENDGTSEGNETLEQTANDNDSASKPQADGRPSAKKDSLRKGKWTVSTNFLKSHFEGHHVIFSLCSLRKKNIRTRLSRFSMLDFLSWVTMNEVLRCELILPINCNVIRCGLPKNTLAPPASGSVFIILTISMQRTWRRKDCDKNCKFWKTILS